MKTPQRKEPGILCGTAQNNSRIVVTEERRIHLRQMLFPSILRHHRSILPIPQRCSSCAVPSLDALALPGQVPVSCDCPALTLLPPAQAAAVSTNMAQPDLNGSGKLGSDLVPGKNRNIHSKKTTKRSERRLTPMWCQVHWLQECKKTPSHF